MQCQLFACTVLVFTAVWFGLSGAYAWPSRPGVKDIVPAVSLRPGDLQTERFAAQAMFQSQKFSESASRWKALIKAGANQAYDYYWLAESFYHLEKYTDAANVFEQAVHTDPKVDNFRVRLVEACLASKDQKKAQMACAEALAVVSDPYAKHQLEALSKVANRKASVMLTFKPNAAVELHDGGKR